MQSNAQSEWLITADGTERKMVEMCNVVICPYNWRMGQPIQTLAGLFFGLLVWFKTERGWLFLEILCHSVSRCIGSGLGMAESTTVHVTFQDAHYCLGG